MYKPMQSYINIDVCREKRLLFTVFLMAGRELPFGNYEKVSVQLLIWKRKTKLYLFFLKARKGDSLPSGMLYDLVNVNK
jgi:hypothetical protein